jgi:hypothetical protein
MERVRPRLRRPTRTVVSARRFDPVSAHQLNLLMAFTKFPYDPNIARNRRVSPGLLSRKSPGRPLMAEHAGYTPGVSWLPLGRSRNPSGQIEQEALQAFRRARAFCSWCLRARGCGGCVFGTAERGRSYRLARIQTLRCAVRATRLDGWSSMALILTTSSVLCAPAQTALPRDCRTAARR